MEAVAHGDRVYFLGGESPQGAPLDKVYQIDANEPQNSLILMQKLLRKGTA